MAKKTTTVSLEEEQHNQVIAAAEKAGISRTEFMRNAVLAALNPAEAKEKIVEKEVIVEKIVHVPTEPAQRSGMVAKIIDDADTTSYVVWGLVVIALLVLL